MKRFSIHLGITFLAAILTVMIFLSCIPVESRIVPDVNPSSEGLELIDEPLNQPLQEDEKDQPESKKKGSGGELVPKDLPQKIPAYMM